MRDYAEVVRGCMANTLEKMLKPARLLLGFERIELADRSGLSEEVIAEIEDGRDSVSPTSYLALASLLENTMSMDSTVGLALNKILIPEYAHAGLPEYYLFNIGKLFKDMTLTQQWFISFTDCINQLCKDNDDILADREIELLISNYRVFLDETVLENENFPSLLKRFEATLRSTEATLIVPLSVQELLQGKLDNAGSMEEDLRISRAMDILKRACNDGLLRILGSEQDGDVLHTLKRVFHEFRNDYRFALITQDDRRAQEIKEISFDNDRKAPVLLLHMNDIGALNLYGDMEDIEDIEE